MGSDDNRSWALLNTQKLLKFSEEDDFRDGNLKPVCYAEKEAFKAFQLWTLDLDVEGASDACQLLCLVLSDF